MKRNILYIIIIWFTTVRTMVSQESIVDSIQISEIQTIIELHKPIIIDGRDSTKFCNGHIPGAIKIDAFDSSADSLIHAFPREKNI